jgi:hypothetical protein
MRANGESADLIAAGRADPDAGLAVLRELEASLLASRRALLALDLGAIERGTSEQAGLIREFDALLRPGLSAGTPERIPERIPERQETLRQSAQRILEASRLQAALLARAQRKLRVLANMLAGPSASYGGLRAGNGGQRRGVF